MVAARGIIALSVDADQRRALVEISRSRTEPANRVERARIILGYLEEPSAYAVARAMGVSQQTVTRCLERTAELGVLTALDDRARTGRDATITVEASDERRQLIAAAPPGEHDESFSGEFPRDRRANVVAGADDRDARVPRFHVNPRRSRRIRGRSW